MTTATLASPRPAAGGRHFAVVAAFALFICAVAGGYGLAVGEVEAFWAGLSLAACVAVMLDYRLGAILLVLLLPVSSTSLFPHSLLKITGLNPINLLLAGTLAGCLGALYVEEIYPPFFDALIVSYTDWRGYLRDELLKPMFTVLAAVLVGAAVAKARRPEPYVAALAIGACALALVMFGFIIASEVRLGALASPRARTFFMEMGTHANALGRVFVTAYALLLFSWWENKHAPSSLALFAALGILSFGILLTFSRNAFLGFFLVNALFLMWKFNMKKLGLALLGTVVAVALAPDVVYRRITYGFDEGPDAVSAGRFEGIWAPLLPETTHSPLWGNGIGSIMWSDPMHAGAMSFVGHPHNAYLEALLDMGLLGLGLLLAYYWHVWRGFRALGSNAYLTPVMRGFFQGACAALLAFALAGMTGGSLRPQPENALLWITIGMMYGLLARRPAD
jgi:O-antigen ligase